MTDGRSNRIVETGVFRRNAARGLYNACFARITGRQYMLDAVPCEL